MAGKGYIQIEGAVALLP